MKTFHSRSTVLAGSLALVLMTAGAFAANAPSDPDPISKDAPMQDTTTPKQSPTQYSSPTQSTTPSMNESSKVSVSMQSKFDTLDTNHDGYIDKQEAAADQKLISQFSKLDANSDAKLSLAEFANAKGLALNKVKDSTKMDSDRQ